MFLKTFFTFFYECISVVFLGYSCVYTKRKGNIWEKFSIKLISAENHFRLFRQGILCILKNNVIMVPCLFAQSEVIYLVLPVSADQ